MDMAFPGSRTDGHSGGHRTWALVSKGIEPLAEAPGLPHEGPAPTEVAPWVEEGQEVEFGPCSGDRPVRCPTEHRAQGGAGRRGFAGGVGSAPRGGGVFLLESLRPARGSKKGLESQGGD